ncbi:MAG: hypothetical protein IJV56_00785 [Neisseriaceae bacterium]|nr:hypothetical protein [Neisseriaceae bacterium]
MSAILSAAILWLDMVFILLICPISLIIWLRYFFLIRKNTANIAKINLYFAIVLSIQFVLFILKLLIQSNDIYNAILRMINLYQLGMTDFLICLNLLFALFFVCFLIMRKIGYKYFMFLFYSYFIMSVLSYLVMFLYDFRDELVPDENMYLYLE